MKNIKILCAGLFVLFISCNGSAAHSLGCSLGSDVCRISATYY